MSLPFHALLRPVFSLVTLRTTSGLPIPQQGGGAALMAYLDALEATGFQRVQFSHFTCGTAIEHALFDISKWPGETGVPAMRFKVANSGHPTPATAIRPLFRVITP
jgi:hypothetical protein